MKGGKAGSYWLPDEPANPVWGFWLSERLRVVLELLLRAQCIHEGNFQRLGRAFWGNSGEILARFAAFFACFRDKEKSEITTVIPPHTVSSSDSRVLATSAHRKIEFRPQLSDRWWLGGWYLKIDFEFSKNLNSTKPSSHDRGYRQGIIYDPHGLLNFNFNNFIPLYRFISMVWHFEMKFNWNKVPLLFKL